MKYDMIPEQSCGHAKGTLNGRRIVVLSKGDTSVSILESGVVPKGFEIG